jgi:putative PIN family toxin of toxin-antitoxin system
VLKAVVDTNVLVSGTILSRGNPYEILEAWRRSQFILVLSPDIIAEVEAVLRRPKIFKKYGLTESLLARLISALDLEALIIRPSPINPLPDIEPADLKFLACADASSADYLVTGDRALQNLKTYKATRIVSPRVFLTLL